MPDPTDPVEAGTLRVPAALIEQFHGLAAAGHDVARALDRNTAVLSAHVEAESPLIEAHHRREAALEDARAKAAAKIVADAELAAAKLKAENEAADAGRALARKQIETRAYQVAAAILAIALAALGTYMGTQ